MTLTDEEIARAICGAAGCPLVKPQLPRIDETGCNYGCNVGRTTGLFDAVGRIRNLGHG